MRRPTAAGVVAATALMGALAAGCGPTGRGGTADGADRPAAGPSTSGPLVTYQRSGGIAGVREQLVVQRDGRVSRTTRSERCDVRLNPRQLADLRTDLERAGFERLRGTGAGSPPPGAADGFSYVIGYQGRTIRGYDPAVPDRMQPALTRLNRLMTMPCLS